jgi:hypothetical protein
MSTSLAELTDAPVPDQQVQDPQPKPKAKGTSLGDVVALGNAPLKPPVPPEPKGLPRMNTSSLSSAYSSSAKEGKPALNRALAWLEDFLGQSASSDGASGEYLQKQIEMQADAQKQMKEGYGFFEHAQGLLAPVEGFGGIAEMSLGAIAYVLSPVTTLLDQSFAKPVRMMIDKYVEPGSGREAVKDLVTLAPQFLIGGEGAETALAKTQRMAAETRKAAAENKIAVVKAKAQTAFDELAAKDSDAAHRLADYVSQVDPKTAKWLKAKIEKIQDKGAAALDEIGRAQADQELNELAGNVENIIKGKAYLEDEKNTGLVIGGKPSKTKGGSSGKSAPSGYSTIAHERPAAPEPTLEEQGLAVGAGKASPGKSKVKGAPSGYSELGLEKPEERGTLGVSLGQEATTKVQRRKGIRSTGDNVPRDALGREVPIYQKPVERGTLGVPLNEKGDPRKAIKKKVGPMPPPAESKIPDSTLFPGQQPVKNPKPSTVKSGPSDGPAGSGVNLITPEAAGASIRTAAKDVTEALNEMAGKPPESSESKGWDKVEPGDGHVSSPNKLMDHEVFWRQPIAQLSDSLRNSPLWDKMWEAHDNKKFMTAKGMLEHMIKAADRDKNGLMKRVLTKIHENIGDIPVVWVDEVKDPLTGDVRNADGMHTTYNRVQSSVIQMRLPKQRTLDYKDKYLLTKTFIHEAVHAVTVRELVYNPTGPFAKEIMQLYNEAVARAKALGVSHYGLRNVREFAAEAVSNPFFQEFLAHSFPDFKKSLPAPASLFDRVAKVIARLLGLKDTRDAQFFRKVLHVTEKLMDQQGGSTPKYTSKYLADSMEKGFRQHLVGKDAPTGDDILYFNMGIPVTRRQIAAAFDFTSALVNKIPGVEISKAKLGRLYEGVIETFNPEAKGPLARIAGSAIAQNFFKQYHKELLFWNSPKVQERRTYWNKMGEKPGMDFIHAFEKGLRFDNPVWEAARRAYKVWANEIYKQDMLTGFKYELVDHYMPHLFKDPEGVRRWLTQRYGNKWADPSFIHKRGFDLYKEAMEQGHFSPKFTNPEDIMLARQQASDIARYRTELLADLESKGVAIKAKKGADRPPSPEYHSESWRTPTGERYWVAEEAYPLMKNALDSKGLWDESGSALRQGVSKTFKGYMGVKNRIVPLKLALSAFHPMHVMHIDAAAEMTRGSKLMLGKPSIETVGNFMMTIASSVPYTTGLMKSAPFIGSNQRLGMPLLRVFQGLRDVESLSGAEKFALKDLTEGGLIPTRPMQETANDWRKMVDAWHKGAISEAAFHAPFAALTGMTGYLYHTWIPSLKIASYLKDVKVARELNPDWTTVQRQVAFRGISRKVEARYGEMNYNTMFMHKTAKDIGVATNLSLGWNLGMLDQYVGGAIDATKLLTQDGTMKQKIAAGTADRPIFAMYYIGSALLLGAVMHYMFTGKQPQSLIDYTHPESGEVDEYGKPVRLNTMWYTREFEGLHKHMEQQGTVAGVSDFVLNKGAGIMSMAKAALTGVNSLGQEIRDSNSPAYKQLEQTLASVFSEVEPISIEAIERATDQPVRLKALSVLGFTPAGKYIDRTETEGKINTAYNTFVRPAEKSYTSVQLAKTVKDLKQSYESNDPSYSDKMEKAAKEFDLDQKDVRRLEKQFNSPKEINFDPSIFMFQKLPWEQKKKMLGEMKPEEREKYLPHLSKRDQQKWERSQDGQE